MLLICTWLPAAIINCLHVSHPACLSDAVIMTPKTKQPTPVLGGAAAYFLQVLSGPKNTLLTQAFGLARSSTMRKNKGVTP